MVNIDVKKDRIKVSANFYLDEFIDPHTYLTREDNGRGLIDVRLFCIAQRFRTLKKSGIVINNWWHYLEHYKGDALKFLRYCESKNYIRKWSGLRTQLCSFGGQAHRGGYAIDMVGDQKKYYQMVKDGPEEFYNLGVRRIEEPKITNGWLHVDTWERNTKPNSIRVVDLVKSTETITW